MSETKSDYWSIRYTATIIADVVFEEDVTEEEAISRFLAGDYEDVVDSEELEPLDVESAVSLK